MKKINFLHKKCLTINTQIEFVLYYKHRISPQSSDHVQSYFVD